MLIISINILALKIMWVEELMSTIARAILEIDYQIVVNKLRSSEFDLFELGYLFCKCRHIFTFIEFVGRHKNLINCPNVHCSYYRNRNNIRTMERMSS
jgi:hypothetical protein